MTSLPFKYDNNGNLQWASRYDYNQNVDIAADIVTEGGGDQLTVTGGSEDTAGVWDYTTVSYDINGNQISVAREPSDETNIKKPKDIVKDGNKNYYITGRSAVGEQSFNVNLDGLVPGIYIYRIGIGEDVQHLKVIKN